MAKKRGLAANRGLDALLGSIKKEKQIAASALQDDTVVREHTESNEIPQPIEQEDSTAAAVNKPSALPVSEQTTDNNNRKARTMKKAPANKARANVTENSASEDQISLVQIDVTRLQAGKYQPRRDMSETALAELASSIEQHGVMQPIVIRPLLANEDKSEALVTHEIIAGERRWRAAKMAGKSVIPAIERALSDELAIALALIENIQREDLDAIEIALSYQRLLEELEFTQEELSTRIGKKRSTIANYLRLLKLPAIIQKGLIDKQISMGHARAIINIENPDKQTLIYNQIIKMGLSVRRVEEIVRNIGNEAQNEPAETEKQKFPKEYKPIKKQLDKIFSSKVDFSMNSNGKGKIVIPFNSRADLDRIVKIIENQK